MSSAAEPLKTQLAALPTSQRAELALFLIRSLDDEVTDDGVDEVWEHELARRVAEIKAGTARSRPADEVFRDLRGS